MFSPYQIAAPRRLSTTEVLLAHRPGAGRRFLLLHGNPGSMFDFAPLFEPLGALGSVASYDAAGFGRSPWPTDASLVTLDAAATQALEVMDALEWEDAVVVGHSHGGGVAQRLAARAPERTAGLVLLGTLGIPAHLPYRVLPLPGVEVLLGVAANAVSRIPDTPLYRMVRGVMDLNYAPERAPDNVVSHQYSLMRDNPRLLRTMARVSREEPCDLLAEGARDIRAPTKFLHGEEDRIVPIRFARRLFQTMRAAGVDATFQALPGAGHMLAAQRTSECVNAVRDLL